MRYLKYASVALLLSACATHPQPPVPPQPGALPPHAGHMPPPPPRPGQLVSQGNLTAIAVEAPADTSQEALNKMLYKVAALRTVRDGYDKFEVVDGSAWSAKDGPDAAKMRAFKAQHLSNIEPSAMMNIRMFHYNDKGSENAIDARSYLPAEKRTIDVVKNTAKADMARKEAARK